MGDYIPQQGDLVFFEHDRRFISKSVAALGGPPVKSLKVSHCAIVWGVGSTDAMVIENTLDLDHHRNDSDPIGGGRLSSLRDVCTHGGSRRLVVIRRGQSSESAVNDAAWPWLDGKSDYSISLLLLAGLASLLRALPCDDERRQYYWKLVHRHARAIDTEATDRGRPVGTCVGTLAEVEHAAGQDLGIKEPPCPGRIDVWRRGGHLLAQIEAMAVVAWLEAERAARQQLISERVAQALRVAEASRPASGRFRTRRARRRERATMSAGGDTTGPPHDPDRATPSSTGDVRDGPFGPADAANWVLDELRQVIRVHRADRYALLRDLLIAFHVLDELYDEPPGWDNPPGPGDDVFRPLMPLDLILAKYSNPDQLLGPYEPYKGP